MRRRTVLATGATTLAALAGCTSDGSGDGPGVTSTGSTGDGGGTTAGDSEDATVAGDGGGETAAGDGTTAAGATLSDAVIARDLSAQPSLGPAPREAESVIVEVSDPSCPTCRSFHAQAFPRIESELVEPGRTAFVVRNVARVYGWARTASAALEAVHERAPAVYWDLLGHYFATQGEFTTGNVRSRTEAHLEGTEVDGAAVVDAVDAGEYDDAVSADEAAARDAGAQGQPYFFLFKNGRLRTSFSGAQGYDVFRSSLGY